jgi:hypothetical protein
MNEELVSLQSCCAWRLAEVPSGRQLLPVRWAFELIRMQMATSSVTNYHYRFKALHSDPVRTCDEIVVPVHNKHATLRAML